MTFWSQKRLKVQTDRQMDKQNLLRDLLRQPHNKSLWGVTEPTALMQRLWADG